MPTLRCLPIALMAGLQVSSVLAQSGPLNDTGQRLVYTATSVPPLSDPPDFPG